MNFGWKGTTPEFLSLELQQFIDALAIFIYGYTEPIAQLKLNKDISSQIYAWEDCFNKLQQFFKDTPSLQGELIFEYAILRGSGRRPDVLFIVNGQIFVIECKSYDRTTKAEYFQTSLYVRDIELYHSSVLKYNAPVTGILLLTTHTHPEYVEKTDFKISIATMHSFGQLLQNSIQALHSTSITADKFLAGIYKPSPSILEAARAMLNEDLPRIQAVDSSNFDKVLSTVEAVIEEAKNTNTHHLVLISGVPGAGKTFLGLRLSHNTSNSVYLSGNRTLVEVLQDTLKNETFVQHLNAYKKDYMNYNKTPREQVIIFDEAQRAWDAQKTNRHLSDPDIIVKIAKENKPWSVVVGLIGDGQEIHIGEEGGLALWNTAILNEEIIVHAKHDNKLFTNAFRYKKNEHLHLNCSLRSHAALNYYALVNAILDGDIQEVIRLQQPLAKQRYPFFITDNLEVAKSYVRGLYENDEKTYGVVYTSGADHLKHMQVVPSFAQRNVYPKPAVAYFNYPSSDYYCKNLRYAASEFQTQGLELDSTIVYWDEDLCWDGSKWVPLYTKEGAKDPLQMKLNAYRVLLTRGRDATIIYVPPKENLLKTWNLFTQTMNIPTL